MTSDEFGGWKHSENTIEVFKLLQEEVDNRKYDWSKGNFKDQRINDEQVGFIKGLIYVMNGEFISEEIKDEE